MSTPEPDRLARWTEGERELPLRLGSDGEGIDAVAIATPNGEVVIGRSANGESTSVNVGQVATKCGL